MAVKCVGASDLHLRYTDVPPAGDVLVLAGDYLMAGTAGEYDQFLSWLRKVRGNYQECVLTVGNHDRWMEDNEFNVKGQLWHGYDTHMLIEREVSLTVRGETKRIYGTPYISKIGKTTQWAYELPAGPLLAEKWDLIPEGLDLLIMHMPPLGIMDQSVKWNGDMSRNYGCPDLRKRLFDMGDKRPRNVVAGHIHSRSGVQNGHLQVLGFGETNFYNLSICDEDYEPTQAPIVFEI